MFQNLRAASLPKPTAALSPELTLPFRVFTETASFFVRTTCVLTKDSASLGFPRSPAYSRQGLQRRSCQAPSEPTPCISTLPAGRSSRGSPRLPCRVSFTPTTLLSFSLQGFDPSRDPCSVSGPDPPLPFVPRTANRLRCATPKVCSLWKSASQQLLSPRTAGRHALLVVLGLSGVFPSVAVETDFPVSSPCVLCTTRRPRSRNLWWTLGCCRTTDRFHA